MDTPRTASPTSPARTATELVQTTGQPRPASDPLADAFSALDTHLAVEPPVASDSPTPKTIGEYHVLRVAGRGGMGVVYEAVQTDPPRAVAVKVLRSDLRADPIATERFRTEIRAAGRLHHTNIVPVLATAVVDGTPIAYSMPFIRGDSLALVLRGMQNGGEPPTAVAARVAALRRRDRNEYVRSAVEWVRQAAEAVAAAHASGIVHRDVKPGNLLLEFDRTGRPHVWLTDFGLAVEEGDPKGHSVGLMSGTPGYRSPEQAAGLPEGACPPADVYSLGVTLSALLTLHRAKEGEPVACGAGVPRELRRVIVAATAVTPGDRYSSAAALADDLGRFLAGYPVHAGRWDWGRGIAKWAGRHRRALTAAGATFVVAVAAAVVLLADAYAAERSARLQAGEARRVVAANILSVDDILYATPGKLDAERKMLEQSVRVQELQLVVEPNDRFATRHLAHASWRLSRVYTRTGRADDAVAAAERADRLYRVLAAAEPGEPLHLLDAARAQSMLANAHRVSRPANAVVARTADWAALVTVREAAERFPNDLRVLDALATYTHQYASSLLTDGQNNEAEAFYREAIERADRCRKSQPNQWRLASPAAAARMGLSQAFAGRGQLHDALTANAEALALSTDLLDRALAEAEVNRLEVLSFRMTRTTLLVTRGEWLIASGGAADEVSADLDAAVRTIATEHPDRQTTQAERAAHIRAWVAFRNHREKATASAGKEHLQLLQGRPESSNRSLLLSRWYADGPGERDPAKAEREAREALRLSKDDPSAQFALAVAEYRSGRLAEAAKAVAPLAIRPPHRTTFLLRAALAARDGRTEDARQLVAEAATAPVPVELCQPEWEEEVRRLLADQSDAPRR